MYRLAGALSLSALTPPDCASSFVNGQLVSVMPPTGAMYAANSSTTTISPDANHNDLLISVKHEQFVNDFKPVVPASKFCARVCHGLRMAAFTVPMTSDMLMRQVTSAHATTSLFAEDVRVQMLNEPVRSTFSRNKIAHKFSTT